MDKSSLTTVWSRAFVDELARLGVSNIALAPGSRSTPLVMACARDDRFKMWTHLDERSAGFFALGVGKYSRLPCAVITTSGTAAANLLPAVIEAHQSGTPLLLLTADRPALLRGTDSNQTIDQVNLYGSYVKQCFEIGEPVWRDLERIRNIACRAFWGTQNPCSGPVHVNLAFEKPLEPQEPEVEFSKVQKPLGLLGQCGRSKGRPLVNISPTEVSISHTETVKIKEVVEGSERGLIIAGGGLKIGGLAKQLNDFSNKTGFPIIADPLSGVRFNPNGEGLKIKRSHLICGHSGLRQLLRPDLIVRIGSAPVSEAVCGFLQECRDVSQLVISGGSNWDDHLAVSSHYVAAEEESLIRALNDLLKEERVFSDWKEEWQKFDKLIEGVLEANSERFFEGNIIRLIGELVPPKAPLFVSNSMPIRDLDVFGPNRQDDLTVYGNRGASGIDGIVSTVAGIAGAGMSRVRDQTFSEEECDSSVVAILGDIAFCHDMNGLLAMAKYKLNVLLVVINNDGGGIFHKLPIREYEPEFTSYFTTPHGLEFEAAAELYGIPYRKAADLHQLAEVFSGLIMEKGPKIIEIQVDRDQNWHCHREILLEVNKSIDELL